MELMIIIKEAFFVKKILVYGSKHWDSCAPLKELLSKEDIKFVYLDITENMFNLKSFLKYRDNYEIFESIKKENRVGLPCVVVNNGEKVIIGQLNEEDLNYLKQ